MSRSRKLPARPDPTNGRGLYTSLRLAPDLARTARIAAAGRGQSLHAWVLDAIRAHALRQAQAGDTSVRAALEQ